MSRTACPDCNEELKAIKILDATAPSPCNTGIAQVKLAYSLPEAKQSFFLHEIKREGTIQGKLCPKCGHILLYAGQL